MAVYPSRMAPIGAKLWENAFQTIPDISFFDAENQKKLNGRSPLEHGSDRRETLGNRISDDSRHFIFRRQKKAKLRTAVYPLRMAPFGLRLWENAFQVIPDI